MIIVSELLINIVFIILWLVLIYIVLIFYNRLPANRMNVLKQLVEMAVHDVEQRFFDRVGVEKKDLARAAILGWMREMGLQVPVSGLVDAAIESAVLLMNQKLSPNVKEAGAKAITAVLPVVKVADAEEKKS